MVISLKHVVPVRGVYAKGGHKNLFPERMAYLAPDAANALTRLEASTGGLIYSDMFRSAEASLVAVSTGRGAQTPGYSAHNFGLAVDLDVDAILQEKHIKYRRLLEIMEHHGWYCYCRDGKRGREDWHFNFLGPQGPAILSRISTRSTWKEAAELAIQSRYEGQFSLTATEVQKCLRKLRLYSGDIDGVYGPLTEQAIDVFTRAWKLPKGTGARFERTLAYVACDRDLGGLPQV